MTTPETALSAVKPLRPLFVWALLGYTALSQFFEFLYWITPAGHSTFVGRAYSANFTGLFVDVTLPLVAVLLAASVAPVMGAVRLVALMALVEYAFMLVFSVLTFLVGLGEAFNAITYHAAPTQVLGGLLLDLGSMGIAALAGFAVLRIFTALGGRLPQISMPPVNPPQQ